MKVTSIVAWFLAISFLFSPIHFVLAQTQPKNVLPKLSDWTSYGTTSIGTETVKLTGSSSGWVYVDIEATKVSGSYLVLASHANKSDSRSFSESKQSSGNPYMYAYLMDSKKKINKYLTADIQTTSSRSDSDRVVYGIFPIESSTKTIRVFLKQSNIKDVSNTGANVTFTKPVLYSASSKSSAQTLLDQYATGTSKVTQTSTRTYHRHRSR